MEYGISLSTSAHHWQVVKRAEQMGFTYAWFFDTPLLNAEVFVALAAAAVQTSKIKLCTGVLIPSHRIAPVTASALASLNALAPGRIVFGVGTGFTARRAMGLAAIKIPQLEEYVRTVQALLRGETVEWGENGDAHKIRFLNPELKLINLDAPIPVHLSAFGPRGQALTARLGAGWIYGNSPNAGSALAAMRKLWSEAGRDAQALYSTAMCAGCVLGEGEPADSPRAREQAGPSATMLFHDYAEHEVFGAHGPGPAPQFKPQFDAYREIYRNYQPVEARYLANHRGHLMFLRPEEHQFITPELIRGLTLTGTQAELVDSVRGVRSLGFSQLAIHLRTGHEMAMLDDWAGVIEKV